MALFKQSLQTLLEGCPSSPLPEQLLPLLVVLDPKYFGSQEFPTLLHLYLEVRNYLSSQKGRTLALDFLSLSALCDKEQGAVTRLLLLVSGLLGLNQESRAAVAQDCQPHIVELVDSASKLVEQNLAEAASSHVIFELQHIAEQLLKHYEDEEARAARRREELIELRRENGLLSIQYQQLSREKTEVLEQIKLPLQLSHNLPCLFRQMQEMLDKQAGSRLTIGPRSIDEDCQSVDECDYLQRIKNQARLIHSNKENWEEGSVRQKKSHVMRLFRNASLEKSGCQEMLQQRVAHLEEELEAAKGYGDRLQQALRKIMAINRANGMKLFFSKTDYGTKLRIPTTNRSGNTKPQTRRTLDQPSGRT